MNSHEQLNALLARSGVSKIEYVQYEAGDFPFAYPTA